MINTSNPLVPITFPDGRHVLIPGKLLAKLHKVPMSDVGKVADQIRAKLTASPDNEQQLKKE